MKGRVKGNRGTRADTHAGVYKLSERVPVDTDGALMNELEPIHHLQLLQQTINQLGRRGVDATRVERTGWRKMRGTNTPKRMAAWHTHNTIDQVPMPARKLSGIAGTGICILSYRGALPSFS